jgi:hypothetical protein
MLKINLGLSHMPIADKIAKAKMILQKMTGNAHFPTPNPKLTDIQTQLDATVTAKTNADAAKKTSIEMTAIMHQEEKALDLDITKLANYVEVEANDDVAIIESSGFTPASKSTPVGTLPQPQNCGITTGDNAGELDPSCDNVKGAKTYVWQINTVDPVKEDNWKDAVTSTKSTCIIPNLASGTRCWVRVAAVGTAGRSAWSDPATKIVP